MTDRYQPLRDAIAAGPTKGPWFKAERLNGPWWHIWSEHLVSGEKCAQGRQAVACVHGEGRRGSKVYVEMFEANARLIAAADPDTIAALLRERDALRAVVKRVVEIADSDPFQTVGFTVEHVVDLRAALDDGEASNAG